jgi:hypothetical protein
VDAFFLGFCWGNHVQLSMPKRIEFVERQTWGCRSCRRVMTSGWTVQSISTKKGSCGIALRICVTVEIRSVYDVSPSDPYSQFSFKYYRGYSCRTRGSASSEERSSVLPLSGVSNSVVSEDQKSREHAGPRVMTEQLSTLTKV